MPAPTVVIGTAGHIDHGKTALLRALTGIDADRLPEERARGMTIDVGYAHMTFDDGVELDFVDVPGHDRLIGNMLVGAGEIDAAMLVVAADDGPRPQTVEHLQLIDALGIDVGLVVITKTDLVDATRVEDVREAARQLVRGTCLERAPIVGVSSVTGAGVDGVRAALRDVRDAVAGRMEQAVADGGDGPVRLAVDRVFTATGRGVVVTGSLRGGRISAGDALRREPGGEVARVRELQVHSASRTAHPGGRTAVNLTGLPAGALRRGDVLTIGPRLRGTDRLLVAALERPSTARSPDWRPAPGSRLRLHIGTDQVDARLRRIRDLDGAVLLDLDRPTATFPGDRAILREPGSGRVVAGVRVLDTAPPRGASRKRVTAERAAHLAAAIAAHDATLIETARVELHGVLAVELGDDAQSGPRMVAFAEDISAALADGAIEAIATHHRDAPLSPGLPLPRARAALLRRLRGLAIVERRDTEATAAAVSRLLEDLVDRGRLARRADVLLDPSRGVELPAELLAAMDRLEVALAVLAPPSLDAAAADAGCPPEGVRALQADGRIVRIAPDLAWSTPTYHRLAGLALELARTAPLTPAALRDATGTSRRYVLAILEDLDRRGILQRTPEGHIPGPRAPRQVAAVSASPGAGGGA